MSTQNNSALEVKWALLCKNASIDQQSNQVSLFNILEELTINKGPLSTSVVKKSSSFSDNTQIPGEFTLVVQFEKHAKEGTPSFQPEMELKIVDPDGDLISSNILPLNFEENKNRLRAIVAFSAFVVKNPGVYNYVVSIRSSKKEAFEEATRVPVDVKIFE